MQVGDRQGSLLLSRSPSLSLMPATSLSICPAEEADAAVAHAKPVGQTLATTTSPPFDLPQQPHHPCTLSLPNQAASQFFKGKTRAGQKPLPWLPLPRCRSSCMINLTRASTFLSSIHFVDALDYRRWRSWPEVNAGCAVVLRCCLYMPKPNPIIPTPPSVAIAGMRSRHRG